MSVFMTKALGLDMDPYQTSCEACLQLIMESELGNEKPEVITEGIGDSIKNAWNKIVKAVKSFIERVKKWLTNIWNWIKRNWNAFVSKFKSGEKVEIDDPDKVKKADELLAKAADECAKGNFDSAEELANQSEEMYKAAKENPKFISAPEELQKRVQSNLVSADMLGKAVKQLDKGVLDSGETWETGRNTVSPTSNVQQWNGKERSQARLGKNNKSLHVRKKVLNMTAKTIAARDAEINKMTKSKINSIDPAAANQELKSPANPALEKEAAA